MRPPGFIRSAIARRTSSGGTVRRAAGGSQAPGQRRAARLREAHPLARAVQAVETTWTQWTYVAAVVVGSVIGRLNGARWAGPLAGSAILVLTVLSLLLAFRIQDRHDRVIDVILDGQEDAAVPIVQRERDRLLSTRGCAKLSGSLAQVVHEATRPPRRFVAPSLITRRVIAPVADELAEISELLLAEPSSARGVARVGRMLRDATSPLYGDDVDALRHELGEVRELLEKRSG